MASILSAVQCPHCGRSAIEDFYYKIDEKTTVCYRCGYYYSRKIKCFTSRPIQYTEEECAGYGVFRLTSKEGEVSVTIFNGKTSQENLAKYVKDFSQDDIDQEKSFLVTYEEGIFNIHCGTPSENFHLPFEEYKVKMLEKYGEDEFSKYLVPIED